jgi:hypothetical protein
MNYQARRQLLTSLYEIDNPNRLDPSLSGRVFGQEKLIANTLKKMNRNIYGDNITLLLAQDVVHLVDFVIQESYKEILPNISHTYYIGNIFNPSTKSVVALLRTNDTESMAVLSKQMTQYPKHKYHILCVPFLSHRVGTLLEYNGTYPNSLAGLESLKMLDYNGIFNMVQSPKYAIRSVCDDPFVLYEVKQSIPLGREIYAFGAVAEKVAKMFSNDVGDEPSYQKVIIIDRKEDLLFPLLSSTTYGGYVLDTHPSKSTLLETSHDVFYNEHKYDDYHHLGIDIDTVNRELSHNIQRVKTKDTDVEDLQRILTFIESYPKDRIALHIDIISSGILPVHNSKPNFYSWYKSVEEKIFRGESVEDDLETLYCEEKKIFLLRLLCLQSLLHVNIEEQVKSFIQQFGYKYHITIKYLNEFGYTLTDTTNTILDYMRGVNRESKILQCISRVIKDKDSNTLVYVIGGITYDEVALIKQKYPSVKVATTNIISGTQFLESFL